MASRSSISLLSISLAKLTKDSVMTEHVHVEWKCSVDMYSQGNKVREIDARFEAVFRSSANGGSQFSWFCALGGDVRFANFSCALDRKLTLLNSYDEAVDYSD